MRVSELAVVLVTWRVGFAPIPEKKDPQEPLPDDIVKVWRDAGAEVGPIPAFQFHV